MVKVLYHVLQGEAEGTGTVQPGEEMVSERSDSSLQHLQGSHLQKVKPEDS